MSNDDVGVQTPGWGHPRSEAPLTSNVEFFFSKFTVLQNKTSEKNDVFHPYKSKNVWKICLLTGSRAGPALCLKNLRWVALRRANSQRTEGVQPPFSNQKKPPTNQTDPDQCAIPKVEPKVVRFGPRCHQKAKPQHGPVGRTATDQGEGRQRPAVPATPRFRVFNPGCLL